MKRRTMMVMFAVLGVGLVAGVAGLAFAHHGGREGMMKRFVSSAIDDALAAAQPTPEQRAAIYAARDRAFAVVEEHRKGRRAHIEEALALFEAEPDPARLQAFRERAAGEHARVREAISQAIVEAHDVLTPAQRKAVADYVRQPSRAPHAVKAPAAPRTAALLVEDDTRLGALVTEYLAKHDIDVTVAGDGERGLAALGRGRFDVVLLDVMLPGVDGLEVCRRLRAAPALGVHPRDHAHRQGRRRRQDRRPRAGRRRLPRQAVQPARAPGAHPRRAAANGAAARRRVRSACGSARSRSTSRPAR